MEDKLKELIQDVVNENTTSHQGYILREVKMFGVYSDLSSKEFLDIEKAIKSNPSYIVVQLRANYTNWGYINSKTDLLVLDKQLESHVIKCKYWNGYFLKHYHVNWRDVAVKASVTDGFGEIREVTIDKVNINGIIELNRYMRFLSQSSSWGEVDLHYELHKYKQKFFRFQIENGWYFILNKKFKKAKSILLDVVEEVEREKSYLEAIDEATYRAMFNTYKRILDDTLIYLGYLYLIKGNMKKAMDIYRLKLSLHKDSLEFWSKKNKLLRDLVQMKKKKLDISKEKLEEAIGKEFD